MVHRTEIDLTTLEGPKAAFDHPETLIGQGGVSDTQGVVISEQHPFAIEALGLSNRLRVQTYLAGVSDCEVAPVTARGQQLHSPLGGSARVFMAGPVGFLKLREGGGGGG